MKKSLILLFSFIGIGIISSQSEIGLHVDELPVVFGQDTVHNELLLMWHPTKGALRAGLMKNAWDYGNIGNVSTAFGSDTQALGNYSFASGLGNYAISYAEFSIGRYSLSGGSVSAWSANDPIFEIGNGLTAGSRSNLFTVQKNGNVFIGDLTDPSIVIAEKLVVAGGVTLGNSATNSPLNGTIRYNGDFEGYMGGTWSSLTDGGGTNSQWIQSGSQLHYSAGNIGLGTSSPKANLHINAINNSASTPAMRVQVNGATKFLVNNNGGVSIGTNAISNSLSNGLYVYGEGRFLSDVYLGNEDATGYRLSVDGKIISEEVRVQDSGNWPDYVFADDYELRSIEDLEASILENHHLPGIPSAKEVEADGILLGDMQKRMMEKIEELVLYTIQQEKRILALEKLLLQK